MDSYRPEAPQAESSPASVFLCRVCFAKLGLDPPTWYFLLDALNASAEASADESPETSCQACGGTRGAEVGDHEDGRFGSTARAHPNRGGGTGGGDSRSAPFSLRFLSEVADKMAGEAADEEVEADEEKMCGLNVSNCHSDPAFVPGLLSCSRPKPNLYLRLRSFVLRLCMPMLCYVRRITTCISIEFQSTPPDYFRLQISRI